jgi:mono/diheme cytochrome c family protein
MKKAILMSVTAACVAALCFAVSPATNASGSAKKEVTFNKDVASILYKNCAECHRPNDIAPMSLLSYKETRPWARSIKEKVVNREMPPWSPDPAYGEFTNDHRLAQNDVDTIVAWVDQGAKEGDAKDLPKMPEVVAGGWGIGKPDVVLPMAEEHVVKPDDPDQYINYFIPTNFKEDVWIQAAEIHPSNRRVVHHVIAFLQTPQNMAKRMDDAKATGEKVGKRSAGGSGLFYLDGNLRRVKMDAPVVNNACEQSGAGGRSPGGNDEGANEGTLLAGFAPGTEAPFIPQELPTRSGGFYHHVPDALFCVQGSLKRMSRAVPALV